MDASLLFPRYITPKRLLQSSDLVPDYVGEFPEVFAEAEFNQLPERQRWDHAIDLTPGPKLSDCKIYPLDAQEQKALDEFLENCIVKVTHGIPILFCQEERWKTETCPRLP